jgi:hypothetical protein
VARIRLVPDHDHQHGENEYVGPAAETGCVFANREYQVVLRLFASEWPSVMKRG